MPEDYYGRLEAMGPEEAAVTFIGEVLSQDRPCGDPAITTVEYNGRKVPVCYYHSEWFQQHIGLLKVN